jgi:hypothetical protein
MRERPHYVYVAASDRLLTWSKEAFDRIAVKVGISQDPSSRVIGLNGRHPITGQPVPPCCGCTDWVILASTWTPSEESAEDLEERFIASFEPFDAYVDHAPPWPLPFKGAGEGELVLLPERPLVGMELRRLDADLRHLYSQAFAELPSAIETTEPEDYGYLDDEQMEAKREWEEHVAGSVRDSHEAQDRAALSRESGHFYED